MQTMISDASDIYQGIDSINRVILLLDYAMYIVAKRYQELAGQKA